MALLRDEAASAGKPSLCCPKCGAGRTSLVRRAEYLLGGQQVDTIVCLMCSHRLAERPVHVAPQGRTAPPSVAPKPWVGLPGQPCKVQGCEGTYHFASQQLCTLHSKRLSSWENAPRHIKPPPIALVDGVWIEREIGGAP